MFQASEHEKQDLTFGLSPRAANPAGAQAGQRCRAVLLRPQNDRVAHLGYGRWRKVLSSCSHKSVRIINRSNLRAVCQGAGRAPWPTRRRTSTRVSRRWMRDSRVLGRACLPASRDHVPVVGQALARRARPLTHADALSLPHTPQHTHTHFFVAQPRMRRKPSCSSSAQRTNSFVSTRKNLSRRFVLCFCCAGSEKDTVSVCHVYPPTWTCASALRRGVPPVSARPDVAPA